MLKKPRFWERRVKSPAPPGSSSIEDGGGAEAAAPAVTRFVTGINAVYEPQPASEATVDIIFVHGITGDREGTWTAPGAMEPWPGQFLPKTLPNARILLFGYDARVFSISEMVSQGTISSHAKSLLNALANRRNEAHLDSTRILLTIVQIARPIVFVAHSMGGLVCEDALLLSRDRPEAHLRSILASTKAIAFLGTPHNGAGALAEWAGRLGSCINLVRTVNQELLATLETDSQILARIQDGFLTMIRARQLEGLPEISFTCFYEQFKLPLIGYVVPPHSAILPGYISMPMNKTHTTMTKFLTEQDPDYQSLHSELRRWYQAFTPPTIDPTPTILKRRPQNDRELFVVQYSQEFQASFDETLDQFVVPVPYRLLSVDQSHWFAPTDTDGLGALPAPSGWQRLLRLFHRGEEDNVADPRLRKTPLALVPVRGQTLLALVKTSDVFRILASSASLRQKTQTSVTIHHTKFSIVEPYQQLPVVRPIHVVDGDWVNGTSVATKQWGDAFTGLGPLPPDVPYGVKFVSSQPGYETIQLPALLALCHIPRDRNVLFATQVKTCYILWQSFVDLLCEAWDHDDAYECTSEEVPLKKYIDSYSKFAFDQRLDRYRDGARMMLCIEDETCEKHNDRCYVLMAACAQYFSDSNHADQSFENEDLVSCINTVLAHRQEQYAPDSVDDASASQSSAGEYHTSNTSELMEGWYARWGFEGARWLLIVLTTTLGHNFCSVQALPESFDCLLKSPNCYVE